jgi:Na+/H+-dicarboxylate symporter
MAVGIGTEGVGVFSSLGALVLAVAIAVVIHIAFTYLFVLMRVVAGVSPVALLRGAKDAMLTAFATRSWLVPPPTWMAPRSGRRLP